MPFKYDPKISFGNIVTICMVVVGAPPYFPPDLSSAKQEEYS